VIPVRPAPPLSVDTRVSLKLGELTAGERGKRPMAGTPCCIARRRAPRVAEESPVIAETYAVELQLARLRISCARSTAALASTERPSTRAPLHAVSAQRRRRLALALRALDARIDGSTYAKSRKCCLAPDRSPNAPGNPRPRNRTIDSFNRLRLDAWRLSRIAAATTSQRIEAQRGYRKSIPLSSAIPLCRSSPRS